MILVSVGTHPQPFHRMLQAVARTIGESKGRERVVVQAGHTPFSHARMEVVDFIPIQEFESLLREARVFITHAGEGNIGTAMKFGIPMIIFPRTAKKGEHTNDHQFELARAVEKNALGIVVTNETELRKALDQVMKKEHRNITLQGHIPQALHAFAESIHLKPRTPFKSTEKNSIPRSATIIVATLNGGDPVVRAINGMLAQQFKGSYDIVVVDDGSFDGVTPGLLRKHFSTNKRVKLIFLPRSGVCKARNAGIRASTGEVVINLDHDCIPEKDWLQTMVNGFNSPAVGIVSAYGHFGGTSTGFRKELLDHVGGYDEDYFYYREDTDLSFKIMELGYRFHRVTGARYREDRTLVQPRGVGKLIRYAWQRYRYHMNDVLLHKKHPTPLCERMLHVRFGHFVDPVEDFKVVTGLWENPSAPMVISSPRGMAFMPVNGVGALVLAIAIGMGYALGMKIARLAGSIKHGHLLV